MPIFQQVTLNLSSWLSKLRAHILPGSLLAAFHRTTRVSSQCQRPVSLHRPWDIYCCPVRLPGTAQAGSSSHCRHSLAFTAWWSCSKGSVGGCTVLLLETCTAHGAVPGLGAAAGTHSGCRARLPALPQRCPRPHPTAPRRGAGPAMKEKRLHPPRAKNICPWGVCCHGHGCSHRCSFPELQPQRRLSSLPWRCGARGCPAEGLGGFGLL